MTYLTKILVRIAAALVTLRGIAGQIVAVDFSAPKIYSTGSSPRALVVADFNGDRKPDVAKKKNTKDVSVPLWEMPQSFQSECKERSPCMR